MRNYEAIIGNLYPYDVDEYLIHKVCIDNSVIEEEEYTVAMKEKIARVSIEILVNLTSLSSESDSGYSLSYNVDKLKERIVFIARSNGFADIAEQYSGEPKVEIMS